MASEVRLADARLQAHTQACQISPQDHRSKTEYASHEAALLSELKEARAAAIQVKKPKKRSFLRRFLDFGIYDDNLERELSKLKILRRATRRTLILRKKTITRKDASITVENANSPSPKVTVQASVRQAEMYTSQEVYEPEEISKRLRRRLPAVLDPDELEKPIGDLAYGMSSAEIRLLMERAAAREATKERSRADHMRKQLESATIQATQSKRTINYERKKAIPKEESLVLKPRIETATTIAARLEDQDQDHPSRLEYYQRLGVIDQKQSRKFLEQQRMKLHAAREKTRLGEHSWTDSVFSPTPKRQWFDERRPNMISEGEDIGLVPKEVVRAMRPKSVNKSQAVSRITKRPTTTPNRSNAFFRNRDKSALVAKFSAVSMELVLLGDAARAVADSDVIGAVAPHGQTKTITTSSITVSEETVTLDPDDPVPKRTQAPTYSYTTLTSEEHFRLLAVEPSIESGRFLYEMRTFGISEAPPFESVSYVWGQDERKYTLSFSDSSVLKITPSLFLALPLLSQHCRTGYLWIDQICIDQSNLDERNHQVKSMGAIYRKADKVLVFLDPVPRVIRPEGLFTLLSFVETSISAALTPLSTYVLQQALAQVIKPHYNEGSDHAATWRDLVRLFQHPWFTRAWVFQELVLSDIVLFAMGKKLAPLDALLHLATVASHLESGSLLEFRPNECLTKSPGLHQLQLMAQVREERMICGSIDPESFWDIFSQVAPNCQLSDERDRLYAFLGLFADPRIDIQPDYRTSVTDVFVHAASAVIEGQNSLDLLAFVDRSMENRSSFPSWVPDWRQPQKVSLFNRMVFSAALGRQHVPASLMPIVPNLRHGLRARGMIIDQITYVATSSFYSSKPWESRDICSFLNLEEHVDRLIRSCGKAFGKPTQVLERLLRTILADGVEASMSSNATGHTALNPAKLKRLLQVYLRYERFAASEQSSQVAPPSPSLLRQLRRLSNIAFGRRIFATKSLRLGLGPERIAAGDYVCILHGSSLPVVLRKQRQVKGQCYLEGVMHGEEVKWRVDDADEFWIL
jgi:hypothetical protein